MPEDNETLISVLKEIRDVQKQHARLLKRLCIVVGVPLGIIALVLLLTIK